MSEPNITEESLSDEEETISTINTGPSVRSSSPESQCPICLDGFTNLSYTDSCLHSFCFECLLRWSKNKTFCPLCKSTFNKIYHSFDAMGANQTYDVPIISPHESNSDDDNDELRLPTEVEEQMTSFNYTPSFPPIIGQQRRTEVYSNNLWAEPIQGTTGSIRNCSPDFYRNNPSHVRRLHLFILRDIIAIRQSLGLEDPTTRLLYTNFSIAMIYDYNVQHIYRPPPTEPLRRLPIETIVLNSENEEVQRPTIVSSNTNASDDVIHCSCIEPLSPASVYQPSTSTGIRNSLNQPNNSDNDSDVVILKHIIRPINPLNSASIDQPSTSTGIRDSIIRPRNM
eukprot:XP_016658753.1 PREDICTED: uncharacterized protein LOC107883381 [Acyrthosiphon pisum]